MGPFLTLFVVDVAHAYFGAGACRGLRLSPTEATARRLQRCGCLWRGTERGVVVLFDASATDALMAHASDADDPLHLHWLARSGDPHFANYTDGPVGSPGGPLVLDSLDALPDEATGRCRLRPAGRGAGVPALSPSDRRPPPHLLATVRIGPDEVSLAGARSPRTWSCDLPARSTVWKYYLMDDLVDAGEQVEVVDAGRTHQFEDAIEERLDDGRHVLAVRSSGPIPLQDRPLHRFQLRRRASGAGQVLVKRLPVASPSRIHREVLGGTPTWISEIYVHR